MSDGAMKIVEHTVNDEGAGEAQPEPAEAPGAAY
jgi:hypothetical protein